MGIFAASPLRDTHHSGDKEMPLHSLPLARAQRWDLCLPPGREKLAWGWRAGSPEEM